jgi:L-serine dehydratase
MDEWMKTDYPKLLLKEGEPVKVGSVFDLLGPVMVGPSSSHTAGAVRLGLMAAKILGAKVKQARIQLHGSFAETGKGHGTHLALTAGLLGMKPDDRRIREASQIALEAGLETVFENVNLGDVHPNSVRFLLTGWGGEKAEINGSSLGGGKILITGVNGFEVEFTGEYPALIAIYMDYPGMIAEITKLLAGKGINIAQMKVSREGKGQNALAVIETDEPITDILSSEMKKMPMIEQVMFIDPS